MENPCRSQRPEVTNYIFLIDEKSGGGDQDNVRLSSSCVSKKLLGRKEGWVFHSGRFSPQTIPQCSEFLLSNFSLEFFKSLGGQICGRVRPSSGKPSGSSGTILGTKAKGNSTVLDLLDISKNAVVDYYKTISGFAREMFEGKPI